MHLMRKLKSLKVILSLLNKDKVVQNILKKMHLKVEQIKFFEFFFASIF